MVHGASSARVRATAAQHWGAARVVAVVLFLASAALGVRAAWARWAVCFDASATPPVPGMPVQEACTLLQDHRYDYSNPAAKGAEQWVPIGDAALLEGLSLLLLGVAVVLAGLAMADRWILRALGGATALPWFVTGVPTLLSGLAGEPVAGPLTVVAQPALVVVPVLTFLLVLPALIRDGGRGALFWLAMTAAQPLVEHYATLMLASSHDGSPWTGFFRCAAVVVAALAVAATLLPRKDDRAPIERFLDHVPDDGPRVTAGVWRPPAERA